MKIMFCLGSMTKGGAERVIANLSNYLVKTDDISIVVTPPGKSSYRLDDKIDYRTLDSSSTKKSNILIRTLKRIKKLNKIIKEINPDVIVSLLPEPSYRVMLATFFDKRKVIISVRNDPKVEYNSFLKKTLMKFLYSRANGFIFQTEEAKSFFSKNIQKNSIIIPNPINSDFINDVYTGKRNNNIVSVGRLTSQKNHKNLIQAFCQLNKKYNEYELHIYGDGELKEELEKQIKESNIEDKVFLEGNVDNIKTHIYNAKMFVLSSDYEGMPNALMEAMALGIPCISTDCPCGGPSFLIKNGENGILVNVNDIDALEKAMTDLIEDNSKAKKIGLNASKIGEQLSEKVINKKWYDYIKKIVKE